MGLDVTIAIHPVGALIRQRPGNLFSWIEKISNLEEDPALVLWQHRGVGSKDAVMFGVSN
jgi:hypothetical protein